jgi:hypothetical protein
MVGDRDPIFALEAVCRLRRWLDEQEGVLVADAHAKGWAWAHIAGALGRSRQAVWVMYRDLEG